jgi:hypothetical protein
MLEALSTPRNRNRTFILLGISAVLVIAAAIVGISDNPPGLILMYLSASSFVASFVHPWKASQQFRRLLYASGLGVVVFVILHLLSENVASTIDATGLVDDLLAGAGSAFFVLGTVLCPAGFLIGAFGAVVMSMRERHSRPGVTGTAA